MSTIKPYPEYMNSNSDWIGEIPKGWEVIPLKYCVQHIGSGKTPSGGSEIYNDDGVMFLRSQNIHFTGLKLDDVVFISEEINQSMRSSEVRPYDVLLNITGASLGRVSIVPKDIPKANVNQHVCILRTVAQVLLPSYLNMFLQATVGQSQIFMNQIGISREALNYEQIGEMSIVRPLLIKSQCQIIDFLNKKTAEIDALIADKQRMVELLQELRQAHITEAVTKGLDRNAPMMDSGVEWIDQIPANCEMIKLLQLSELITDGTHITPNYIDEGIPFLSIKDVSAGYLSFDDVKYISLEEHSELSRHACIKQGDVLFCRIGTLGKPVVVDTEREFDIFVSLGLIRTNHRLYNRYLYYVMNCGYYINYMNAVKAGGGTAAAKFNLGDVSHSPIIYYDYAQQIKIVEYLDEETRKIDLLIKDIDKTIICLHDYRQSLITEAVTGKIKVCDQ